MTPFSNVLLKVTRLALTVISVLLLATIGACETASQGISTDILVSVVDDEGVPVQGSTVEIRQHKKKISASATARFTIRDEEGSRLKVRVACPTDFTPIPDDTAYITVRHISDPQKGGTAGTIPLPLKFVCLPREKEHVVIVTTNLPARIPVLVNGKERTHTDSDGIAQFIVKGETNKEVEITLDTSGDPFLLPRNPSRLLSLSRERRFYVFSQPFERKTTKRKKPRRRHKSIVKSAGPVRL